MPWFGHPPRRAVISALCVALVLALAGCSDDDSDTAASSTTDCATVRAPLSARWTLAPSGLEVAASTKTPRPLAAARSRSGCSEPNPR